MLAVWAAKISEKASVHIFHRQGVTWAGKIALKIDPSILHDLAGQVRKDIFIVCGTNGKTTTNNMLCAAIEKEGYKVICNHTGSNMLNGVVAAFVLGAGLSGNLDADYACIEIDEASTRRVFPHFKPDYMVLTNLFRDQLDRYGEIDITMNILKEVMQSAPKMKVIVNGDDALSAYLAMESGNPYVTYGISEKVVDDKDPAIEYDASDVAVSDHLAFTVDGRRLEANYKGFYNVYNILAAYAAGRTGGLGLEHFQDMLTDFNPENGRMEQFEVKGTKIVLNLAKNPAGFNQNISAVMQDDSMKDVIIVINDNAQDGTDVSWLWDVDFDRFKGANVNSITVSGIRCQDMRLRMKYVDIPSMLEADVEKAIRERVEDGCGNLYVLVNYTALFSTRNVLKKMEEER